MVRFATFLITLALAGHAHAGYYDAAADFSPTSDPNGVWSYGWSSTLGGAFNLDAVHASTSGLDLWEGSIPGADGLGFPFIEHNGTADTIKSGTIQLAPGQLAAHPGPQDQYAIVRFTAPTAGVYDLASSFTGLDFVGPATTDVHVLLDGVSIFDGNVSGFESGPSFSSVLTLQQGDTLDFVVGYGQNGNYNYDTTGIVADLMSVPEPSSVALTGMAAVMIAGYGLRRRGRIGRQ